MKDNKMIRRRQFFIWNYDEEIEYLNKLSEEGWHLVYKKPLHKEFIKDTQVSYKYQIDYNDNTNDEERYLELFKEQGWEKIDSKYKELYYFRKKYDESLSEEEYQIYTDKETKMKMFSSYLKSLNVLSMIWSFGALLWLGNVFMRVIFGQDWLSAFCNFMMQLCIAGFFQSGCINIKRVTNDKKKLPKMIPMIFMSLMLIFFGILIYDFWMHVNG